MKDELQVESGHYTRIVNPLIENLIKIPFKGCELAVAIYIIRKTYGYQKKEDGISLSQFQKGLERSRQTIVTALKNLQLVNVARLVKQGSAKGDCNIWTINKYYNTWKLVNMARLVQRNSKPSLTERLNLVQTARHTKEIQKKYKRKNTSKTEVLHGKQWNDLIDSFKEVNPMYTDFYSNNTERNALEEMASNWGYEKLFSTIRELPKIIGQPYAPKITKPTELRRDIGKLIAFYQQEKNKIINNKPIVHI